MFLLTSQERPLPELAEDEKPGVRPGVSAREAKDLLQPVILLLLHHERSSKPRGLEKESVCWPAVWLEKAEAWRAICEAAPATSLSRSSKLGRDRGNPLSARHSV
jgi:hypothetical protein